MDDIFTEPHSDFELWEAEAFFNCFGFTEILFTNVEECLLQPLPLDIFAKSNWYLKNFQEFFLTFYLTRLYSPTTQTIVEAMIECYPEPVVHLTPKGNQIAAYRYAVTVNTMHIIDTLVLMGVDDEWWDNHGWLLAENFGPCYARITSMIEANIDFIVYEWDSNQQDVGNKLEAILQTAQSIGKTLLDMAVAANADTRIEIDIKLWSGRLVISNFHDNSNSILFPDSLMRALANLYKICESGNFNNIQTYGELTRNLMIQASKEYRQICEEIDQTLLVLEYGENMSIIETLQDYIETSMRIVYICNFRLFNKYICAKYGFPCFTPLKLLYCNSLFPALQNGALQVLDEYLPVGQHPISFVHPWPPRSASFRIIPWVNWRSRLGTLYESDSESNYFPQFIRETRSQVIMKQDILTEFIACHLVYNKEKERTKVITGLYPSNKKMIRLILKWLRLKLINKASLIQDIKNVVMELIRRAKVDQIIYGPAREYKAKL